MSTYQCAEGVVEGPNPTTPKSTNYEDTVDMTTKSYDVSFDQTYDVNSTLNIEWRNVRSATSKRPSRDPRTANFAPSVVRILPGFASIDRWTGIRTKSIRRSTAIRLTRSQLWPPFLRDPEQAGLDFRQPARVQMLPIRVKRYMCTLSD